MDGWMDGWMEGCMDERGDILVGLYPIALSAEGAGSMQTVFWTLSGSA